MGKKQKSTPVNPEDLKQLLQSPDEEILGILGTSYLQNIFAGSGLKRSVMIVTNKRLYMRGMLISRGHYGQQDVVVLLEDVSGLRTISNDPKRARRGAWFLGLLNVWLYGSLFGWFGKLKSGEFGDLFFWAILSTMGFLIFALVAWIGKSRMFVIEYSGSSVSVPAKWYSLEEIETFRKAVTAGIETLRNNQRHAPAPPAAAPSVAPATLTNTNTETGAGTGTGTTSIADELKKLADLRDAGVLTDEEFDIQKKRLLS